MSKNQWAASPEKLAALKQLQLEFKGNTCSDQRARIMAALRRFPLNTYELMRLLDVYYPPARIRELRVEGYRIVTVWQIVTTEAGVRHRVALYTLLSEANHG
jgi:Helix-turn-helix domain